jgi:hypothetical protein
VALNDSNVVAYLATLDEGAGDVIFVQTLGAAPTRVIGVGDPLLGSTVTGISHFDYDGLNNLGQVAFVAVLADGRAVVVRADPITSSLPTDFDIRSFTVNKSVSQGNAVAIKLNARTTAPSIHRCP